jgi:hypothetical protein
MSARRPILLSLASLTLGALTTIAISWGLAWGADVPWSSQQWTAQRIQPTRGPVFDPNLSADTSNCVIAMVSASRTRTPSSLPWA